MFRVSVTIILCTVIATPSLAAANSENSRQPITGETLRLAALDAIFPGMKISVVPGTKIDNSGPMKRNAGDLSLFFPDVMKEEKIYRITGPAMNPAERDASENLDSSFSEVREVRIKLFRWPGGPNSGMLAILQYRFPGANPAMSSPSLGVLVHLVEEGRNTHVTDKYLLETAHHGGIEGIEMADFKGGGANELVVESDWGGAGTIGSALLIFDLSHGEFYEIFNTTSRLQYEDQDWYTQVLDVGRTAQRRGAEFCFTKTVLFDMGKPYLPPRVTRPCYERGDGVDLKTAQERNSRLEPLR